MEKLERLLWLKGEEKEFFVVLDAFALIGVFYAFQRIVIRDELFNELFVSLLDI
jgi:hypothetical protein